LIIYKMKEEQYLLVVNASNIDKDWDWFRHKWFGCRDENLSDDYLLLAIQGPKAVEAMHVSLLI
jgi:aminomethyltransferase